MVALSRATWMLFGLATPIACDGDRCLGYDYTPPAVEVTLIDESTGETICDEGIDVTPSRGEALLFPQSCRYVLSSWFPTEDAGPSLVIDVDGYEPVTLSFSVERNGCGEIQRPPDQEVRLTPGGAAPPPDGGSGGSGNAADDAGVDAMRSPADAGSADASNDADASPIDAGPG